MPTPAGPAEDGPPTDATLLTTSTGMLCARAGRRRDERHGRRLTYSAAARLAVPPPGRPNAHVARRTDRRAVADPAVPSLDAVLARAHAAEPGALAEVLVRLGDPPGRQAPALGDLGGPDIGLELLVRAARRILDETGLLVRLELRRLEEATLATLRAVSCGVVLLPGDHLVTATGSRRSRSGRDRGSTLSASLEVAGRSGVPLSILLPVRPVGERAAQLAVLRAIVASHEQHGQVQAVGVATVEGGRSRLDDTLWTLAVARLVLPLEVHVEAPPRSSIGLDLPLLGGADDLGPLAPASTSPRHEPGPSDLERDLEARGYVLAPRLPLHPDWAHAPERWLDAALRPRVLAAADAEGLARDSPWVAGGPAPPPAEPVACRLRPPGPLPLRSTGGAVGELLEAARSGATLEEDGLVTLFAARGHEVQEVIETADELRARAVGDAVTFVVNRNLNFTNQCSFKCRFCAFSKGPRSLHLREEPYLLPLEEISRRVAEADQAGATEVCLQGGIPPGFGGERYLELLQAVRAGSERIHVHGFSAFEISEGARRLGEDLETFLRRLRASGLGSIPGTAAEILDDSIRSVLCPDKLRTDEWLEVHRVAHRVGLRSTVTIMFGSVEHPRHWAHHLGLTRKLQAETGGFTELVPLPFVHMATPLFLEGRARRGPTFREVLLLHAIARIAFFGLLDNIQASWVKTGLEGLRRLLRAGCNDAGGTLMDEQIAAAAGAVTHGNLTPGELRSAIEPLGRPVVQRTTLYERLDPVATTP